MGGYGLDQLLGGHRNFAGTRVGVLGRIVSYIDTVVRRIHRNFARNNPAACEQKCEVCHDVT